MSAAPSDMSTAISADAFTKKLDKKLNKAAKNDNDITPRTSTEDEINSDEELYEDDMAWSRPRSESWVSIKNATEGIRSRSSSIAAGIRSRSTSLISRSRSNTSRSRKSTSAVNNMAPPAANLNVISEEN